MSGSTWRPRARPRLTLAPMSELWVCLVAGANLATSLHGASVGLRTPEDRQRFLTLRNSDEIGAIVVGSRTAALEPYGKTPHPLYIYSRDSGRTPSQFIDEIAATVDGAILCEGGVRLVHELLRGDSVDRLYLSHAPIDGDDNYLDIALVRARLSLMAQEVEAGTTFEHYERASR